MQHVRHVLFGQTILMTESEHLNQRDVTMIAISKAPYSKVDAFKKRMGWDFKWVSSF